MSTPAERFQIRNRWTDAVMFECELTAECLGMSVQFKLGWAVKKAVEAGADLAGAYLAGADLAGAKISDSITITRAPLQILGLPYPILIFDQHMKIGCELHLIAEWTAFDNERISRMDGTRARRFWDRHKAAILALAASDGRGVEATEVEAV